MTAFEEREKAALVARFPVSPEDVAVLWKQAEPLAPFAGHRVRLLEQIITLAKLINISPGTLLDEVQRLAERGRG